MSVEEYGQHRGLKRLVDNRKFERAIHKGVERTLEA
jgi:hypothetical protein